MPVVVLPNTIVAGQPVAAAPIQGNFVTLRNAINGGLDAANLSDGAVTSGKLANESVTSSKLAVDSVTTPAILNLSVTSAKLDDGAVTTNKIFSGAVTSDKLGTNSVTSSKIADGNVTADKLGPGSVTPEKLAVGAALDGIGEGNISANYTSFLKGILSHNELSVYFLRYWDSSPNRNIIPEGWTVTTGIDNIGGRRQLEVTAPGLASPALGSDRRIAVFPTHSETSPGGGQVYMGPLGVIRLVNGFVIQYDFTSGSYYPPVDCLVFAWGD